MILRALIITLTTSVCFVISTFTDFINIAGAFGSVTVAFILPEILYIKVFRDKLGPFKKFGCVMLSVFGICGSSYSIYFSIAKMVHGDTS